MKWQVLVWAGRYHLPDILDHASLAVNAISSRSLDTINRCLIAIFRSSHCRRLVPSLLLSLLLPCSAMSTDDGMLAP
jgi:hypothetical protein